jgi:hypothetical protein
MSDLTVVPVNVLIIIFDFYITFIKLELFSFGQQAIIPEQYIIFSMKELGFSG